MLSALKKRFNSSGEASAAGGAAAGVPIVMPNMNARPGPMLNDTQRRRIGELRPARTPAGVQPVNAALQKKFCHGVDFNMKIVIRGDRNTGKTSLWRRIQGSSFADEHEETSEIQVASIIWNYRTQDHVVKLDVWDVVDEGRRKPADSSGKGDGKKAPPASLKLVNCDRPMAAGTNGGGGAVALKEEPYEPPACDATIVDVYKSCNGVLLIFDVTKLWTWTYVQRELERVPSQIPVLVLANKFDRPVHEHQLGRDECALYLADWRRPADARGRRAAPIRFTQCSMRNADGLRYIYNFFNIPFLFLQRDYLEAALEANLRELAITEQELSLYENRTADSQINGYFDRRLKGESGFEQGNEKSPLHVTAAALTNQPATTADSPAKGAKTDCSSDVHTVDRRPRAGSSSSSESGRGNRMVDMYEEDFDSNEDETKKQLAVERRPAATVVQKKSPSAAGEKKKSDLPPASDPTDNSMFDFWLSKVESAKQPDDLSSAFNGLGPSCAGSTAAESKLLDVSGSAGQKSTKNPVAAAFQPSDSLSSDDDAANRRNSLVRRFSDEDEDEYSSGRWLSDTTAPSSLAYTVEEEKSFTSCSGVGFARVIKTDKKSLKEPSDVHSGSSTMTSVASKTQQVDDSASTHRKQDKKIKKPKAKAANKKPRKSADNLLIEDGGPMTMTDNERPGGNGPGPDQYDPL